MSGVLESYAACLLAQSGYDVLVQYGANQPHYDLVAVKDSRILPISVKGSQDGGWMLAVKYAKPGVGYADAIAKWLATQRSDVVYMFVQFLQVPLGSAPRVYVARPLAVAAHLSAQCNGRGLCSLQEDTFRDSPKSKYKDRVPGPWIYSTSLIDSV